MGRQRLIHLVLMMSIVLTISGCKKSSTGPDDDPSIPLDGRGGGIIAFSITPPNGDNEIFLMNGDGSGLQQLTDRPGRNCGPAWSPDASQIAFYLHNDQTNTWTEFIMNADGSNIRQLTNMQNVWDAAPSWTPDGRILFGREFPLENYRGEIWMVNPDGSNLHRIGTVDGTGPHCSPDGTRIAYYTHADGDSEIWIMNIDGTNPIRITDNGFDDYWPNWSPDGTRLVFQTNRDDNYEIYVMDADGGNQIRLTNNPADDAYPIWSIDGTQIAFESFRDGNYEIYKMNADGSNQTRLTNTNGHAIQPSWKPGF